MDMEDLSQHEYSSPDTTMSPDVFSLMPLRRVIKREVSLDEDEEIVVDDGHLLIDHEGDPTKRYALMSKSSDLLQLSSEKEGDGVDESLLDSASTLGAYAIANNSAYSTTEFPMDTYPLSSHLQTAYVYEPNTYQAYYQYPMPSPTSSSTNYILASNLAVGSPSSDMDEDDDRGSLGLGGQGGGARAHPETINWLKANYEKADGSSLPRCTLYEHYKKHCMQNRIEPVNAASFGKLIRSIFDGLKTRRLGTRGNSKYHYYGIRVRPTSALNVLSQDYACEPPPPTRSHVVKSTPYSTSTRRGMSTRSNLSPTSSTVSPPSSTTAAAAAAPSSLSLSSSSSVPAAVATRAAAAAAVPSTTTSTEYQHGAVSSTEDQHKPLVLGEGNVPHYTVLPSEETEGQLRAVGLTMDHLNKFTEAYYQNCQDVLFAIRELRFDDVEDAWKRFWQYEEVSTGPDSITPDVKVALCSVKDVQRFITLMDFNFLQILCDVLVPDLLAKTTQITESLNTRMRNFAKIVEQITKNSCEGAPLDVLRRKEIAARMMAQTLRKYTSLAHLSFAARQVCDSADGTTFLADDLTKIDLSIVQEQSEWVSNCDTDFIRHLVDSFKDNLAKKRTLDEWADWMEAVVDQILAKYHDQALDEITKHAKQFLLNWSFFSSMVIRDLTLRSAHSFGHFHLLRLLFDEYLLHLVESKLAKAADQPILAVRASNMLTREDAAMLEPSATVRLTPQRYSSEAAAYINSFMV